MLFSDRIGQRDDSVIVTFEHNDNGEQVRVLREQRAVCSECDGLCYGYYDEKGDTVCECCGALLNGDTPMTVSEQWGDDSRGFSTNTDDKYD